MTGRMVKRERPPSAVRWISAVIAVVILVLAPLGVRLFLGMPGRSGGLMSAGAVPINSRAPAPGHSTTPSMRIISSGMPAYASSNIQPNALASYANDDDYSTSYRSDGLPAWLAYDLSSVPVSQRHRVLAVYYNSSYAYNTVEGPHYNNLRSYAIEGNVAKGGGPAPLDHWVRLVSVEGNTLHSRQHIFNLTGYNWVRIVISLSDGSPENYDAAFNEFDIYDLSQFKKPPDDWIFYGDSVTAEAMITYSDAGTPSFAELIHQAQPWRWPVVENGGEPYDRSADAVARILGPSSMPGHESYLSMFPGRYVVLSYGMNDARPGQSETVMARTYVANMSKLVRAVIAAGKAPVIPKINYTSIPAQNVNIQILNHAIDQLYRQYPKIVRGPDFWTFFKKHPTLVGPGDIHPTLQGYAQMRRLWAQTMLRRGY